FGHSRFQFVDADSGFALGFFGSALQPKFVDLGENAILPGHPPIAKYFQISFAVDLSGFGNARSNALSSRLLESRRRVVRKFWTRICTGSISILKMPMWGHPPPAVRSTRKDDSPHCRPATPVDCRVHTAGLAPGGQPRAAVPTCLNRG